MSPPYRSPRSYCVINSCLAALILAACSPTDPGEGQGGSGGRSSGSGGTVVTTGGTIGTLGSGGASATGSGGTTSSSGGSGSGGASTGGATGSGGRGSGSGGAMVATGGTLGSGGAAGGRNGSGGSGRGGSSASGGAGGKSTGGSSGGTTGSTGGSTVMPGAGCTPPTTYANLFVTVSGHTQADSDAKVSKAWSSLFSASSSGGVYFDGPGSDESYVKDTYNGDVRTEGMSYGMMAAVQLDHQTEFDRLWTWVKKHMANGTGEISWSCSTSGGKNSTGGAPDGEEYMATALIFANKRWGAGGKYDYAAEAQWVLDLIRTKYFNASAHIVKFVSGSGNTDGSYVLPAFYQVWACFDTANAAFWDSAVTAAREFFPKAIDGNGVIGDQSSFTGQTVKGAGSDTIRCVMNIMMDHNFFNADPWQTDMYATKYGGYMKSQNPGVAQMSCNALLGFGLPADTGKPFVDKLWSAGVPNRDYWNGVLYMLGLLHVSGTFKLYY